MAEEPKKDQPEDISSILSDLDAILSVEGGIPPHSEPSKAVPPPKAPPKVELPTAPSGAELSPPPHVVGTRPCVPKPEPVKAEAPKIEPPQLVPPVVVSLAAPATERPREEVPPPQAVGTRPAAAEIEELPADAPKDQIRRVAYVHTFACAEAQKGLVAFLSSAARTISKKPLFLRAVLSHEVGNSSDPNAILEKAKQVKAVAILAVIEGWPPAKTDELSEACSRAGLLFRLVASADAQKKSTAVDIIVDMMLLSGEV